MKEGNMSITTATHSQGENRILEILRAKKYPPPQFVMYRQMSAISRIPGMPRPDLDRSVDAVVASIYINRGVSLTGIEVKTTRQDWKKELKEIGKAAPIQRYCNHWYIAAPPGIVQDGELPEAWGLWTVSEAGVVSCAKVAPPLSPEPITLEFFCQLLRRAEQVQADLIAEAVARTQAEGGITDKSQVAQLAEHYKTQYGKLLKRVKLFETRSGVKMLADACDEYANDEAALYTAFRQMVDTGKRYDIEVLAERLNELYELSEKVAACWPVKK